MNALCPSSHLALTGAVICLVQAGMAAAETVTVLDHVVVGETRIDGEKIGEFSSLIALPDGGILGISDRGYIAEITLEVEADQLARVEVTAIHILTGQDGAPVEDSGFSPEAAALLPDGGLAIVDETTARLAVFDTQGTWLRDEQVAEALRDVALQASEKDGIEALAWAEATGFIAVTEEPYVGHERNTHTIQTALAGAWTMQADGSESISIKGLEAAHGQLFVLERTRDNVTDALHPFLRILDLADCTEDAACTGTTHPLIVDGITDADFEGIAAMGNGRFLIVSDDKIEGDLRSVFLLVDVN